MRSWSSKRADAAACPSLPRGSCGNPADTSVAFAEVQRVGLVDHVIFSGALVSQLGCEQIESLANVRDVDCIGLGSRAEFPVESVGLVGDGSITSTQLVDLGTETRLVSPDRGQQTVCSQ